MYIYHILLHFSLRKKQKHKNVISQVIMFYAKQKQLLK